jgi:hypothetical protein
MCENGHKSNPNSNVFITYQCTRCIYYYYYYHHHHHHYCQNNYHHTLMVELIT